MLLMISKINVRLLWICDFVYLLLNWCLCLMLNIDPILELCFHIIVYLLNMNLQMRKFAALNWLMSPKRTREKKNYKLTNFLQTKRLDYRDEIYRYFCFSFYQIGQLCSRVKICWRLGGIRWLLFALFHSRIFICVFVQWWTHFFQYFIVFKTKNPRGCDLDVFIW